MNYQDYVNIIDNLENYKNNLSDQVKSYISDPSFFDNDPNYMVNVYRLREAVDLLKLAIRMLQRYIEEKEVAKNEN